MTDLETVNTSILGHALSPVLTPGKAYTFAIDVTNDPCYGTVYRRTREISSGAG
ncbi:MAG TPA: hypothetical protein PK089_02340 [Methanoregulaceae archaeon]|nr:hypothetical protein [Methanoregulaceae archaeon]HQJ87199.1 hypothetical protein [Methanoregulaceae archaeon]